MASLLDVKDNRGSVKGKLSEGDTSDDHKLQLSGTAKANGTVRIFDGDELIGTTTADKNGNWKFTTPRLDEGTHRFSATEVGKKSRSINNSDEFEVTIDKTIAEANDVSLRDSTFELSDGMVHGNGDLTLSGKAEAGAKVEIFNDGTVIAEVFADSNGDWSHGVNLGDGNHSLQTKVTDQAGNRSDLSADAINLTIDSAMAGQPPANSGSAEVILPPGTTKILAEPSNDNTPLINGSATPGSEVTLSVFNGNTGQTDNYGPITVDSSGNWTIQITNPLPDGKALFRAKASNQLADTYIALEMPIDTELPEQPTIDYAVDNVGLYQGELDDESRTDDDVVTLHGTAEANSLVYIYANSTFIGFTVTLNDGSWSYTPTISLLEGDNTFVVTSSDAAGNISPASDDFNLTLDRSADSPDITHINDDQGSSVGNVSSGGTTDDSEPLIVGQAEAGALVDVSINGKFVEQVVADTNGEWQLQVANPLDEGSYKVTAVQTDVAGNQSGNSESFDFKVILNTGPEAKSDSARTAVGKQVSINVLRNDSDSDGDKLEVIKIVKHGGYGRAEITANGKIVFTPDNVNLRDPVETKVVYKISDGKGGTDTATVNITLYPKLEKPTIDLTAASDRGWSNKDNITNDKTPTLQGNATPGSTVTIYQDGNKIATVKANQIGKWKFTPSALGDGDYDFSVTSKQLNDSMSSKSLNVTIDTQLDASASFTADSYTNSGSVQISISANEKVRYTLQDDAKQLTTLTDTVDASATVNVSFAGTAAIATHTYKSIFTDRAGNKSAGSDSFNLNNPPPVDPTAALEDGGYIVTFFKPAEFSENGFDIYAQRYDAHGNEVNPAFIVNSYQVDDQMIPDVVGLKDGGYVITWQSFGQDGDDFGIYAQRYDVNDQVVGPEFKVSETSASDQHRAEITSLENGGFVVTWVGESVNMGERKIFARFYNKDGESASTEIEINAQNPGTPNYPTIGSLNNGNVAMVWEQTTDKGITLQLAIYSETGELVNMDTQLSASDGWQMQPHIDTMVDGGFVVSWLETASDGKLQTRVQTFDNNGAANSPVIIASDDSSSIRPEVAGLEDGSFIVSWLEDGVVNYSNYSADNGELLSTSTIEANKDSEITEPHALALNGGGFLITWVEIIEGTPSAVYGQQFNADGEALSDRFIVESLGNEIISQSLISDNSEIELDYDQTPAEELLINNPLDASLEYQMADNIDGIELADVFSSDSALINSDIPGMTTASEASSNAQLEWFSLDAAYNFGSTEGLFSLEDLETSHLGI